MAENWNACLRIATHDFVKVMGQDDLIHEGALMNQAILLETNPNVSLVVSGCNILSSGGRKLFTRMRRRCAGVYPGCEVITDCLLHRANLIGEPVTVMARRTDVVTLGGFSPSHRYYIDLEFWIRLLKMGDCAVVKEPQCSFRIHGSALSSACQQTDFNQFDELPGARDFLQTLLPLQRKYRLLNARISTMSRSLVYRIFG